MIILSLADEVLDAVEILVENKVSGLQFNKTVRAKIAETMDASIGKYRVQYQNSYFTAYASDSDTNYSKGTEVYVEILSNDFEKNALIIGSVRRLGTNYINIIEELDKYINVDKEIVIKEAAISLCSRKLGGDTINLGKPSGANAISIAQAAEKSDAIKIGATVQTNLEKSQQINGNYGIKLVATYYDNAFIDKSTTIDRTYQFDINNMTGQPYKFNVPSNQYGIFIIDAKNFKEIKSITAFCEGFPTTSTTTGSPTTPKDITLSNIHLQFLRALSEEELQTSSLSITTPEGGFFESNSSTSATKLLKADLRIKGKKVNYNAQPIDFYWFKQNLKIFSGMKGFSPYGGNGWELLNTEVSLNAYEQKIKISDCPAYDNNKFKCVAVYTDSGTTVSLSDVIVIRNLKSSNKYNITSSTGTVFSFNTGKTVLTIKNGTNALSSSYKYYWTQSVNGEAAVAVNNNSSTLSVNIATPAADIITYECSVFNGNTLLGTASIDLFNNKETAGSTLVIKNGIQIFKYDEYGTAPTSESVATADRMTIPYLSFDIYDKQGNLVSIADGNKLKYMTVKWIWPAAYNTDANSKLNTMLVPVTALSPITTPNIITGTNITAWGNSSSATFAYGIRDIYNSDLANTDSAMNNIRLEVDYQGEHLVAHTNFTFTKEGELGTNGTKYTARIVPKNSNYDKIILKNYAFKNATTTENHYRFMGIKFNKSPIFTLLSNDVFNTDKTIKTLNNTKNLNDLFHVQLWDGLVDVNQSSNLSVTWSLSTTTGRLSASNQRLTINKTNDTIEIKDTGTVCNILQATITYEDKKFYATYPLVLSSSTGDDIPWLINGYQEVMYESDGSRGKFHGLPFTIKRLTEEQGLLNPAINNTTYQFTDQVVATTDFKDPVHIENTYDWTIEPPSYFIGETVGQYITVTRTRKTISDGKTVIWNTYFPIQLYLNRYGMSAMNDWDGTGIQVKSNGGYILAPQVGAGRKNADNSFTGITIGEVFQNANNKEIGLFGYSAGAQSIFLDAETGNAHFGTAGAARINIGADNEGIAPKGSIYSGNYYKYDATTGKPSALNNAGMLLDLVTPSILFGTGNFSVNKDGHLTAKGGGSIAGWQISNTDLYNSNKKIYLNSSTPAIYGQSDASKLHNSLTSTNNGFYLGPTGESIGSKFYVSDAGIVRIGTGAVANTGKHWTINGDNSNSYINYGTKGANNSVYLGTDSIALGSKFYVSDTGIVRVGTGAVGNTSGTKHWEINGDSTNSYMKYGTKGSSGAVYIGTDSVALGSKFSVNNEGYLTSTSGKIGGWNINSTTLTSDNNRITFNSNGSMVGPNNVWSIGQDGKATFTNIVIKNTTGKSNTVNWNTSGNARLFSLDDVGGYLGGWRLEPLAIYSTATASSNQEIALPQSAKNSNLILSKEGAILGPVETIPQLKNFSPNSRIWEISNNGVAYFADVHISNRNNQGNVFKWTGYNPSGTNWAQQHPTIFELTDTGSNIGGWNITDTSLNSGIVNIDSSAAGSGSKSVISVGEALKIYGNGDINVNNISSGGSGSFTGSLSGANCSFGSGTIGPANFGDVFNIPSGKMQFGGETVTLESYSALSGISPTYKLTLAEKEITVKIDCGNPEVTCTGQNSLSGSATVGGKTGTASVSGNISVTGTVSIGEKSTTIKVPNNSYSFGGTYDTRVVNVMRTGATTSGSSNITWNNSGET